MTARRRARAAPRPTSSRPSSACPPVLLGFALGLMRLLLRLPFGHAACLALLGHLTLALGAALFLCVPRAYEVRGLGRLEGRGSRRAGLTGICFARQRR